MGMKLLQNIDTFEVIEWAYFRENCTKFILSLRGFINRGKHQLEVSATETQE